MESEVRFIGLLVILNALYVRCLFCLLPIFSNQTLIFSSLLDKKQTLTPYHSMHMNWYQHCKYFQFVSLLFSEVSVRL